MVRLGGNMDPLGRFVPHSEKAKGPITEKVKGGHTLLMKNRPALEARDEDDGHKYELLATLHGAGSGETLGVVRLDGDRYGVTTQVEGEEVLMPLSDNGNKPSTFELNGGQVNIAYDEAR